MKRVNFWIASDKENVTVDWEGEEACLSSSTHITPAGGMPQNVTFPTYQYINFPLVFGTVMGRGQGKEILQSNQNYTKNSSVDRASSRIIMRYRQIQELCLLNSVHYLGLWQERCGRSGICFAGRGGGGWLYRRDRCLLGVLGSQRGSSSVIVGEGICRLLRSVDACPYSHQLKSMIVLREKRSLRYSFN